MTGDDLRALRVRANWKQSQLSTALKVTPQYVGMLERGEKEILPHMEKAIREAFAVAPTDDRYVPDGRSYQESKAAVIFAVRTHPEISLEGFPYHGFDNDEFEGLRSQQESRARLFTDDTLAQVATALAWIDSVKVLKSPTVGSYGAKHSAERWGGENGFSNYVANGALLVAAIFRKIPLKRVADSPNARLGLDPNPMPEAKPGTFAAWLRDQVKRKGPLGDLAKDASQDRMFPVNTSSGPKLRSYLRSQGACQDAIDTLDQALFVWRASRA